MIDGIASEAFEHYLTDASRIGPTTDGFFDGSAGGAPCGDLLRISLGLCEAPDSAGLIEEVRIDAEGCGSARAAAAATAELVEGLSFIEACRIDAGAISAELGGLSATGRHAADLAADALHRALGEAAGSGCALVAPADGPEAGTERVLIAMSGGVDSAVAAELLCRESAEVIAVTLKLWADEHNDGEASCCSPEAVRVARGVAHSMGIPHITLDLRDAFRAGVVDPFVAGYAAGSTPNPCVLCNGDLRIDAMVALADRLGAAKLATGHYARLRDDGEGPLLDSAADQGKDQTYMLSGLRPQTLARLHFPLADLTKPEVREIAHEAEIAVAGRAESQDLCFLAGEGKRGFLERHGGIADREGEIVDADGLVLGSHPGHHHFTIGQRRGLGIASTEPLYVLETDARTNRVTVGFADQLEALEVRVHGARLHRNPARVDRVRLRYRSHPIPCSAEPDGDDLVLRLASPARGVAPGQTAALMEGSTVLGHGTISAPDSGSSDH